MLEVTLYDLPGAVQPWSPNSLKIRFLLNAKKVVFQTIWVSYSDVPAIIHSLGVARHHVAPHYTLPTLKIERPGETDEIIMYSDKIAARLEELFTFPPMIFHSKVEEEVEHHLLYLTRPMCSLCIPLVARKLLQPFDPNGAACFLEQRAACHGRSMDAFTDNMTEERAWHQISVGVQGLSAVLDRDQTGPFFHGAEVSYIDLKVGALLYWMRIVDEAGFERLLKLSVGKTDANGGAFARLWQALAPYMAEVPSQ